MQRLLDNNDGFEKYLREFKKGVIKDIRGVREGNIFHPQEPCLSYRAQRAIFAIANAIEKVDEVF